MNLTAKLGLVALLVVVGATLFAPTASASLTCGGRATCVITLTNTPANASGNRLSTRFSVLGGLVVLSCDDSTISSDGSGATVVRSGTSNITTTGALVDFRTNCRVNVDARCTVVVTTTAGDSHWTITVSQPSVAGASHRVALSIGRVTITQRTCDNAGNNGTLAIPSQSLGTSCTTYTSTNGTLELVNCAVTYTSMIPNLPSGSASFSGVYHATIDGTGGASPTVSSG